MEYDLPHPPPPQVTDMCNNMDESHSHDTEQKKPDTKNIGRSIILFR